MPATFTTSPPSSRPSSPSSFSSRPVFNPYAYTKEPFSGAPPVAASISRSSSPVSFTEEVGAPTDIGLSPEEAYDRVLPAWRAGIRKALVWSLRKETKLLAYIQATARTPTLDSYFVQTSLLGTHSFFLVFLPACFWLGNARFARGLINILAAGVYLSSVVKDLLCVPRPYSPPVTRLTIGTHHLEYGFLSTHSTNAVSVALYLYSWVVAARRAGADGWFIGSWLPELGLAWYALSIVVGRIYCGMHSIVDCIAGVGLGAFISWVQWAFFQEIEAFTLNTSWIVPALIIPSGLLMVSLHPEPVDDCPCFEDAIAFVSVVMGVQLGRWQSVKLALLGDRHPFLQAVGTAADHLGNTISASLGGGTAASGLGGTTWAVPPLMEDETWIGWSGRSLAKMALGISCIFVWRLLAKAVCRVALPPIFRFVAQTFSFTLPRRHYTPATDYKSIPPPPPDGLLHPIPSVIDLPSTFSNHSLHHSSSSRSVPLGASSDIASRANPAAEPGVLKLRGAVATANPYAHGIGGGRAMTAGPEKEREKERERDARELGRPPTPTPSFMLNDVAARQGESSGKDVKHYDAEVLTKVITYAGIGFLGAGWVPILFVFLDKWTS